MNTTHLPLRRALAALLALSALAPFAHAERADSQKATEISAEHAVSDGKKNVLTLWGEVRLQRGTLSVSADRAEQSGEGTGQRKILLSALAGKLVHFRQKRDGGANLWVEGQAERIEYDEASETVKFLSHSRVRYLDGNTITQEQEGEFLSYDSRNDIVVATNNASGQHVPGAGRVKLTLQPKPEKQVQ